MRIAVDEEKCISAGQCAMTAPHVFDQRDEDGVVVVLDASPAGPEQAATRAAAAGCPVAAITLTGG
ncbi:ferredoxin [Actinoplanes philippinensis]|uniref:ferredoxin n=1 Tax=Actinoplanes philippinensis TaxID=35752 RepID=UPI0033F838E5